MKKILFFAAMVGVAFTSCMNEEFIGDNSPTTSQGTPGAISFRYDLSKVTRGDNTGNDAALALNRQFYVYGIKKEATDGAGAVGSGNLVYNNYVVKWTNGSEFTSTSNTEGWEYVGYALSSGEQSYVTPNSSSAVQTIKYWDYGAGDYTFYAFSAKPSDITSDYIEVAKVQDYTTDVYGNGYSVTIKNASASLDDLYFAERVNITASSNTGRTADNTYGGNVTFRFHNMASKVRVAMYETIPGYKVTIDKFWVDATGSDPDPYLTNPTFAQMDESITANFAANLQNCAAGTLGTMTVTYDSHTGTATHNWPVVSFDGAKANVLTLGTNLHGSTTTPSVTAGTDLGVDKEHATFDKSDKSFTSIFPNETNSQNLKLKVDYTLTAVDPSGNPTTGETIKVEGATAEIDAKFLKWKPGFAYTYFFKISPNTNGSTGQDVVGLYPITFDAVEMIAEDGTAEYITTVSEPSITTFGAIRNTTSSAYTTYVADGKEYKLPSASGYELDIFATIMDGSAVKDFTLNTDVKVYMATTTDATNFPITEASVAEALAETTTGTPTITTSDITADGSTNFSTAPEEVTSVPGEDGIAITGTHALHLSGVKATTATTAYVIEYVKTPDAFTTDGGHKYATKPEFIAAGGTSLYTDAACTTPATEAGYSSETTYYKKIINKPGTKVYKVIHVEAAS